MCEFCGCGGARTQQSETEISRRGKKRIAIPVATISAPSKAPKINASGFRKLPTIGTDDLIETDEFDADNAQMVAP